MSKPNPTCVGIRRLPEYAIWVAMRQRCNNPRAQEYDNYGGRGIRVCSRWDSFENFLADMGQRPGDEYSLDRFPENDGNYDPGNCRWATLSQQNRNQRKCKRYTHQGSTLMLVEWSEKIGIPRKTLSQRLYEGWSFEEAISRPVKCQVSLNEDERLIRKKARIALNNAVRDGKVFKPTTCCVCNQVKKLHAHHYLGYAQANWLKVMWVCTKCHHRI